MLRRTININDTNMKYPLYATVLMAFAFSSACFSAAAQSSHTPDKKRVDTLRRELTIVNDQTVEMERADPLPTVYRKQEPQLKPFKPEYNRRTFGFTPAATASGTNNLPPLSKSHDTNCPGYLNIGVGHTFNQRLDVGYHLLNTEEQQLNLFISYLGMKSAFETEAYAGDRKERQMVAGIHYGQEGTLSLSTGLNYTNRYFNHYGRGQLLLINLLPPNTSGNNPIMDNSTHDMHAYFGAKTDFIDAKLDYRFFRSIPYMGDDPMHPLTEHTPEFSVAMKQSLSEDLVLGVAGRVGGMFYSRDNEPTQTGPTTFTDKHIYYAEGAPTLTLAGGEKNFNWRIQAGAGVSAQFGTQSRLFFWPKLDAAFNFASSWRLYAEVFGGIRQNGLADVMHEEMPYLMPNSIVLPTRNAITSRLGIAGSIANAVRLELYGNYSLLKGAAFYTPTLPAYNPSEVYQYNVSYLPLYADGSNWRAGAKAEYSYRDMLRFFLDASYGDWTLEKGIIPAMQPKLILKGEVAIRPISPLDIRLGYTQLNGRSRYEIGSNGLVAATIKNAHLLTAHVSYNLKPNFGLYLKLDNVLTETSEVIGFYPVQPFHCFIGFNWTF